MIIWDGHVFLALCGLSLIFLEFMLPTKGALGLLGIILFMTGTVSLTDSPSDILRLTWPAVIGMNILVIGTLGIVGFVTWRGYTRRNLKTTDPFIGQVATVIIWTDRDKRIELGGAVWQANTTNKHSFNPGDRVMIQSQDNLIVYVSPYGE